MSNWPIDRLRRKQPDEQRRKPLVLIETIGNRQIVAQVSDEAFARGIRAPMTLAQAQALCPVVHSAYEPPADRRALIALARWLQHFSPSVSPAPPDVIFLDAGGCQRLYGNLPAMLSRVGDALRRLRIGARLSIAPTPTAALAMTYASADGAIVGVEQLPQALRPLPPAALRLDDESLLMLEQLGIETIGQLIDLPRASLPARFGEPLLRTSDRALARTAEPLSSLDHQSPVEAEMKFDWAVSDLEAIWQVLRQLLGNLIEQLKSRGCGVRELSLELSRPYAPRIVKTIRLSRASRDAVNLFNLLRCALETMEENREGAMGRRTAAKKNHKLFSSRFPSRHRAFAAASISALETTGFNAIGLRATTIEKLSPEQLALLEQQRHDADAELSRLIELLALRLGPKSFVRAEPVQSHLPERAYRCVQADADVRSSVMEMPARVRPLHLFSTPIEVPAIASPSPDSEGAPISFTWKGHVHRIIYAQGPERICGPWWEGRNKTRDYFDAEDAAGRRFWMFRVRETGKWYVQGEYE